MRCGREDRERRLMDIDEKRPGEGFSFKKNENEGQTRE